MRRAPVDDAVKIRPAARRAPRIEALGDALDREHRDGGRLRMVVEGAEYLERLAITGEIEMGHLADGMDAATPAVAPLLFAVP